MTTYPCSRCSKAGGKYVAGDGRTFCEGCMQLAVMEPPRDPLDEAPSWGQRLMDHYRPKPEPKRGID